MNITTIIYVQAIEAQFLPEAWQYFSCGHFMEWNMWELRNSYVCLHCSV